MSALSVSMACLNMTRLLGVNLLFAASLCTAGCPDYYQPKAGETWNIQLISTPNPDQATDSAYHAWDFDMADAPESTIKTFKDKGHKVICYFSAGSWENWRTDKDEFPSEALGKTLDGWEDEKWLDTRNSKIREIMTERIKLSKAKGCDGVDPDNIDGYENNTGFDLTKADGIDYVKFLAKTAHDEGLAYGLKNGGDIIKDVVDVAQWVVNEQCVQYEECNLYQPFIKQNKPVFHLEYTAKSPAPANFVMKSCTNTDAQGFSTVIKHLKLNSWTTTCPQ